MAFQSVFKRYELKYMITSKQKGLILDAMKPYMKLDKYGRTTIRNIYFDTDSYLLIRRSIEKPKYKEKLRVRSYEQVTADNTVFVELKKKFDSVVYKRRISLPYNAAVQWLSNERDCPCHSQISDEIDYFLTYYENLGPKLFLSYEREAYYSKDMSDFRVTFDDNISARRDNLTLEGDTFGTGILPEGYILMEIKCSSGIPVWMAAVLSREKIYKTSFSKYGTAYKTLIFPDIFQNNSKNNTEDIIND